MDTPSAGFLAEIALRTAIVFVLLVVGMRGTGKRQAGEMNVHDLLLVLIIANAVQNAMTKGNGHLAVALVSAGTLLAFGWWAATILARNPHWHAGLVGAPTVLVEEGRPLRANLDREGVTEDELMAAVRDQGLPNVSDVRLAILEIDGSISVVPRTRSRGG